MVGLSEDKTAFVKDFKERHTDTSVYFVVTLAADAAPELLHDDAALAKRLKLETSMSTTNMHLYDLQGEIRKYDSALTVVEDFFDVRLDLYTKRRTHLLQKLEREWRKLDNKVGLDLLCSTRRSDWSLSRVDFRLGRGARLSNLRLVT